MVIELLVAAELCHVELMWVPKFCEGRFDVVFVHAKVDQMGLCARLTNERPICYVRMS